MKEVYKYCIHCGIRYLYQASGYGCHRAENNDKYCPECTTAINETLKKMPIKVKKRFIDTDEITPDQFLHEMEVRDQKIKAGELIFERIFPGLINTQTGESQCIRTVFLNDTLYRMTWWPSKKDYRTEKQVRWDLINDKIYE